MVKNGEESAESFHKFRGYYGRVYLYELRYSGALALL